MHFDYGQHDGKVTLLEPFIGKAGWLTLSLFSVESLDQAEDHLIFAAVDRRWRAAGRRSRGTPADLARHEFPLSLREKAGTQGGVLHQIQSLTEQRQAAIQRGISERNARFFEAEADKLDGWADDLKVGLEREIKELDRQIKEARRAATTALTLDEKLAGQKQIKALEAQRNQKRRSLFDAQDQVDRQRDELIAHIEGKLQQSTRLQSLLCIRWKLS